MQASLCSVCSMTLSSYTMRALLTYLLQRGYKSDWASFRYTYRLWFMTFGRFWNRWNVSGFPGLTVAPISSRRTIYSLRVNTSKFTALLLLVAITTFLNTSKFTPYASI